tara:strand:+ start:246 stop:602 length:357 start_codon:yes stop_codon:yes gene_type:complete
MEELVNLSFLEKFTGGNQSKIKRYISMYLATATDILKRMMQNLDAQNWSDLGINAHSLKPQTDFMGIVTLKNKLIEIENNLKINNYERLSDLVVAAYEIHQKSALILAQILKDLSTSD